jgi:hypothetical protein
MAPSEFDGERVEVGPEAARKATDETVSSASERVVRSILTSARQALWSSVLRSLRDVSSYDISFA